MQTSISQQLSELKKQGAYRQRRILESPQEIEVMIEPKMPFLTMVLVVALLNLLVATQHCILL